MRDGPAIKASELRPGMVTMIGGCPRIIDRVEPPGDGSKLGPLSVCLVSEHESGNVMEVYGPDIEVDTFIAEPSDSQPFRCRRCDATNTNLRSCRCYD